MPTPLAPPVIDVDSLTDIDLDLEQPWAVILYDDPVNMMEMVSRAITKIVKVSAEQAEALMWEAHRNGKVAVWAGTREEAVGKVAQFHAYGLNATVEQA